MGVIRATCINKYRDSKGAIIGYRLRDIHYQEIDMEALELKRAIANKQIDVDNLTLTSDNRLITSVKEDRVKTIKDVMEDYIEPRIYQSILDSMGIDLLGILKLDISDESVTIEEMYKKALACDRLYSNEAMLRSKFSNIQDILDNPQAMIGVISLGDVGNIHTADIKRSKVFKNSGFNGPVRQASMFMMLLHKNGDFRICGVSEFQSESLETRALKELSDTVKPNNSFNSEGRIILTINSSMDANVLNIGNHISNKEKLKAAQMILDSKFEYWLDSTATKKLIAKIGKQNTLSKLKQAGVHTLSVPLTLPVIVGAIGIGTVCAISSAISQETKRIQSLPLEKRIGYMRGPAIGRINEEMINKIEKSIGGNK